MEWFYIVPPEEIQKHYGPGPHKCGSPQSVHAGAKWRKGGQKRRQRKKWRKVFAPSHKRDLQAALPKGTKIRWHANLKTEARAEANNSVLLGPKFWGKHMGAEAQAGVLAHEFGHVLEQVSNAFAGKGFDKALTALKIPMPAWVKGHYEWWGYGGDNRITEALAWAYSDYVAGKLTRGPAYNFVHSLVRKHPEFGRIDFPAIVAQLKPGPGGGLLTIFQETQKEK